MNQAPLQVIRVRANVPYMIYDIFIRPFVKGLNQEEASRIALKYFRFIGKIPGGRFVYRLLHGNRAVGLQKEVFGLQFYNPLGLGAGLDLQGELYNDLNDLGFSFVEIGPLNATSVRHAIANLQQDPQDDILAACINKDFQEAFSLAYDFCDFFVIDIGNQPIASIMEPLLDTRLAYGSWKPIVIKIPEDITGESLNEVMDYCRLYNIDGIEARTIDQVKHISERSHGNLPIIANCHTETVRGVFKALSAGAALVEVRSGLVYKGPAYISRCLKYLLKRANNDNFEPEN